MQPLMRRQQESTRDPARARPQTNRSTRRRTSFTSLSSGSPVGTRGGAALPARGSGYRYQCWTVTSAGFLFASNRISEVVVYSVTSTNHYNFLCWSIVMLGIAARLVVLEVSIHKLRFKTLVHHCVLNHNRLNRINDFLVISMQVSNSVSPSFNVTNFLGPALCACTSEL